MAKPWVIHGPLIQGDPIKICFHGFFNVIKNPLNLHDKGHGNLMAYSWVFHGLHINY